MQCALTVGGGWHLTNQYPSLFPPFAFAKVAPARARLSPITSINSIPPVVASTLESTSRRLPGTGCTPAPSHSYFYAFAVDAKECYSIRCPPPPRPHFNAIVKPASTHRSDRHPVGIPSRLHACRCHDHGLCRLVACRSQVGLRTREEVQVPVLQPRLQ